jgi:hypothetical protein
MVRDGTPGSGFELEGDGRSRGGPGCRLRGRLTPTAPDASYAQKATPGRAQRTIRAGRGAVLPTQVAPGNHTVGGDS